jgi:amino acid transporter
MVSGSAQWPTLPWYRAPNVQEVHFMSPGNFFLAFSSVLNFRSIAAFTIIQKLSTISALIFLAHMVHAYKIQHG